jgi:hypothetical protein
MVRDLISGISASPPSVWQIASNAFKLDIVTPFQIIACSSFAKMFL